MPIAIENILRLLWCSVLLVFLQAMKSHTSRLMAGEQDARQSRDLILVAGQSNAVGYDAYASELPPSELDGEVMFWWRVGDPPPDDYDVTSGGKWTQLQSQPRGTPLDAKSGDPNKKPQRQYGNFMKPEGGFGPEIGFARELMSRQRQPIAIVKVAFSGTSMTQDWNPDDPGLSGACYRALINETQSAMNAASQSGIRLRLRALVWVQGESDATPQNASQYEKNLARMLDRLRNDLNAPELIALLGVNTRFGNQKNPNMPLVIAAQRSLSQKDSRAAYVDTEGAQTLAPSHTHFTAQGTLEVGRRFAESLLKYESQIPTK